MVKKEEILKYHEGGKIGISLIKPLKNKRQLAISYTPGVGDVCKEIEHHPEKVWKYTLKNRAIAIVTDGSRVLGLGNIGAKAAIPVMEGKAVLFKKFGNVDAFPLCIETQDKEKIIEIVKNITPIFGGINLEDIESPKCFEIEERLIEETDIPIFHDDQHGTATVILAGLINATKVVKKEFESLKIIINGAGAAGLSITKLLQCVDLNEKICKRANEVIVCDSQGTLHKGRKDLNTFKKNVAEITNPRNIQGSLKDALEGADVFIGVSTGNVVTPNMIQMMKEKPIVFALSNPVPEIDPKLAKKAGAAIIATGRSDLPNQINNLLAFPGIFRGALDARAHKITKEMTLEAAYAIARSIKKPTTEHIIPNPLDKKVHIAVAQAVKKQALAS